MKFAKALIVAALLAPSVAAAQSTPPTPVVVPPPALIPTNFAFLAPAVIGFVALPVLFQEDTATNGTN